MHAKLLQSCLDSCNPMDLQPARLLCAWDSPGKNTEVDFHALLQGDLPGPGIKPISPALQVDSLTTEPLGKPTKFIGFNNCIVSWITTAIAY